MDSAVGKRLVKLIEFCSAEVTEGIEGSELYALRLIASIASLLISERDDRSIDAMLPYHSDDAIT